MDEKNDTVLLILIIHIILRIAKNPLRCLLRHHNRRRSRDYSSDNENALNTRNRKHTNPSRDTTDDVTGAVKRKRTIAATAATIHTRHAHTHTRLRHHYRGARAKLANSTRFFSIVYLVNWCRSLKLVMCSQLSSRDVLTTRRGCRVTFQLHSPQ